MRGEIVGTGSFRVPHRGGGADAERVRGHGGRGRCRRCDNPPPHSREHAQHIDQTPRIRRRKRTATALLPTYTLSAERHDDAFEGCPWWTIARRLPHLAAIVIRLAWTAAPRAVALTCLLQLVSGAVTALGLYAPPAP